jgi:hypothetical protein
MYLELRGLYTSREFAICSYPIADYMGFRNRLDALTDRKINGAVGNQTRFIRQVATLLTGLILSHNATVS